MKKNKGKYQKEEKKTGKMTEKRKYMSYEDAPLEDYPDDEPAPANLTKRFLKMFLILFLSVVAVMAVLNIEKLTPDNIAHWFQYELLGKAEGDGYPTKFSGSVINDGNFDLVGGVPAYCSDSSIAVLNTNAGIYHEDQHSYADPVLSTNGNYGIVCNVDATGFTLFKKESVLKTDSVSQKIFAADVSSNGIYALLTKSDDYLACLTVYRSDHLEKYKYYFADYYMNTLSVNQNGTRAILTGISARNGGITSVIYVLDFSQNNYLQKYEVEDTFIYAVSYLDNGNAFCVGNNQSFFIDINSGTKTDISYNGRTLTNFVLRRSHGMLLSLSDNPDGRKCDLLAYDLGGNQSCAASTGQQVLSLDLRDDRFAILSSDKITVYDRDGNVRATAEVSTDARKIVCCDYQTYYVLRKSGIDRVRAE